MGHDRLVFNVESDRDLAGATVELIGVDPAGREVILQYRYNALPAGTVGFKSGKIMASADEVKILIRGLRIK